MSTSATTNTPTLLANRYRLEEELGTGRLAVVHRATDIKLERLVLVHLLRADLMGNAALHQRFLTEVTTSAQRAHPALVETFDRGAIDGRPYMVTEYAVGQSLREQGALTPEVALLYVRQISGAIALCQMDEVTHPPISSSNIRLVEAGHVKMVENWQLAPDEAALDLAYYRAPELTQGQAPGPMNAVYALGLLLYELITARRMVSGHTYTEVAQAHLYLKLPPLSQLHPLYYLPSLDQLLQRATSRNLHERFADTREFALALDVVWRDITADTQRLMVPDFPVQQRHPTDPLPQMPPLVPPPSPGPGPAVGAVNRMSLPTDLPPSIDQANRRQQSTVNRVIRWMVILTLLVLVTAGSYAATSYALARVAGVQLPQIGLPSIALPAGFGLPEINLPNVGVEIPSWLIDIAQGEELIVNINAGLNVRDAPGLSSNIIGVVPNGTSVRKLEGPTYVDDVPWVLVRIEREGNQPLEGWMSLDFLIPAS